MTQKKGGEFLDIIRYFKGELEALEVQVKAALSTKKRRVAKTLALKNRLPAKTHRAHCAG